MTMARCEYFIYGMAASVDNSKKTSESLATVVGLDNEALLYVDPTFSYSYHTV